jgi:hypothetical protein
VINLIADEKVLPIEHRAVWLCHQLGIRHQSHSYRDYERAKSYLQSWNLEPGDYDVALKVIVDYVQI